MLGRWIFRVSWGWDLALTLMLLVYTNAADYALAYVLGWNRTLALAAVSALAALLIAWGFVVAV